MALCLDLARCSSHDWSFFANWRIVRISISCFDLKEREWRMESGCAVLSEILSALLFGLVGWVSDLE